MNSPELLSVSSGSSYHELQDPALFDADKNSNQSLPKNPTKSDWLPKEVYVGLWKTKSQCGETYLTSPDISGAEERYSVWQNRNCDPARKHPTYQLYRETLLPTGMWTEPVRVTGLWKSKTKNEEKEHLGGPLVVADECRYLVWKNPDSCGDPGEESERVPDYILYRQYKRLEAILDCSEVDSFLED